MGPKITPILAVDYGDRDHIGRKYGRDEFQAFDRTQYGDRRRNHAVAIQQCRAKQASHDKQLLTAFRRPGARADKGRQRYDPAFSTVVGQHDEREVLDGNDDNQRPEDQRQNPEYGRLGMCQPIRAVQRLAECIDRARTDVAVHDAKGGERHEREVLPLRLFAGDVATGVVWVH